jgi:molybdenum cofactor cytidylyltransferase
MSKLSIVILAAGASRRLGYSKLTVRIDGERAVRRTVRLFVEADVGEITVVTGFEKDVLEHTLEGLPVNFVHNLNHETGMAGSVRASLPAIADATLVLFHLGDKPFITVDAIHKVIDAYRAENRGIIVPIHKGEKGHPVLIDLQKYRPEIGEVEGEGGLRDLVTSHLDDVLFLESEEGTILDLDTEDDVMLLRRRGHTIEKD